MQINAVGSSRSKELKSSIIMNSKELEEKARDHIEELRKNKFSIGCQHPNPLIHDLHHAVTCLSAELYTKHVHFLMELIQNAEDNQYGVGVEPTLEFTLTTNDITRCGAQETLLVFNNEIGFSRKNMESICSVGRSTKKGMRNKGFIGEKGEETFDCTFFHGENLFMPCVKFWRCFLCDEFSVIFVNCGLYYVSNLVMPSNIYMVYHYEEL